MSLSRYVFKTCCVCIIIQVQYESEALAAHQNLESDKLQLFDTVRAELEEKIRRLEEDRHNIDINSGKLYNH